MPLIFANNEALDRQAGLLAHPKRLVRDASHQLRTPLAVLKVLVLVLVQVLVQVRGLDANARLPLSPPSASQSAPQSAPQTAVRTALHTAVTAVRATGEHAVVDNPQP